MTINLQVPDLRELKPKIVVIGAGGAGGNAVNNMIDSGLSGVDFVVANTDAQALGATVADRLVQLGRDVTGGLGAGGSPEVGADAAEESIEDIKEQIAGANMAFVTAGMGGGTGTGAAPVIARIARDMGILTVGVVTKPFEFEGPPRMQAAESGIAELAKYVDTLIVIPNQNLFRIATEETTFTDAFAMADRVLYSGVASITDLMTKKGLINLDFADVKKIMQGMGKAMMGSGEASGENRGLVAAETAISNPLLDDVSIRGARGLLISVVGGSDMKLYEVDAAVNRIREEIDPAANIIFGSIYDDSLDGTIRVSVVATGFANVNSAGMGNAESSSGLGLAELLAGMQPASGARESIFEPGGFQPSPPVDDPVVTTPDGVNIQHGLPHKVQSQPTSAAPEPGYQQPQFMPSAPEVVARPARRMPKPEEFPIVGQKAMQYAEGVMPEEGLHAHKKKIGFFGRLAAGMDAVNGHGSHETVPAGDRMEPEFSNRQQPPPAAGHNRQTYGYENNVNTMMQDEHVELPAFLRRKSVG